MNGYNPYIALMERLAATSDSDLMTLKAQPYTTSMLQHWIPKKRPMFARIKKAAP